MSDKVWLSLYDTQEKILNFKFLPILTSKNHNSEKSCWFFHMW